MPGNRTCVGCPLGRTGFDGRCQECLAGYYASTSAGNSRVCEQCSPTSICTGGLAIASAAPGANATPCPAGRYPDSEKLRCENCPRGQARPFVAEACEACEELGINVESSEGQERCQCSERSYNATVTSFVCFSGGYDADEHNRAIQAQGGETCPPCPTDIAGDACLRCASGDIAQTIEPGFTIAREPDVDAWTFRRRAASEEEESSVLLFRCHDDLEIAIERCPGGPTHPDNPAEQNECAQGYDGVRHRLLYEALKRLLILRCGRCTRVQVFCGSCAEGYGGMSAGGVCSPCEDTGFTVQSVIVLALGILVVVVVVGGVSKLCSCCEAKHLLRVAFHPGRILITYFQVGTALGDVMNFRYPGVLGEV